MTADHPARVLDIVLDDRWCYGPGVLHGGFLVELLTGHAVARTGHPHPLTVTTHFLERSRPGPAQVHVQPLRTGRSVATSRVSLLQEGRTCLDVVVTAGRLADPSSAPLYADLRPPDLLPVEQCVRNAQPTGEPRNGIVENLDLRLDPAGGWLDRPGDRAEVRGWIRAASGREPDPLLLLCFADGLPPATFALGRAGWVPTVELTVHVRALPAPGWIRAVQRARLMQDGWFDEECELWDSAGRLVAQGHQLAAYRS